MRIGLSLRRFCEFYKKPGSLAIMRVFDSMLTFVQAGDIDPSRPSNTNALPVELWYYIASLVERKDDLSRLSRTSQLLGSICRPYLYRSISIDVHLGVYRLESLRQAIENRDIADMITDVSVTWSITIQSPPSRVDKLLGVVLIPLGNLRKLTFCCRNRCCKGRHQHLKQLTTRSLTTLQLDCSCFSCYNHICYEILCAPCMRGVTSICFGGEYYPSFESVVVQAVIGTDSFLPNLKEIVARNLPPFISHFRRGIITSVSLYGSDSFKALNDLLSICPPALLGLVCPSLLEHIPQIVTNPHPYCKVRTLRYFRFRHVSTELQVAHILINL